MTASSPNQRLLSLDFFRGFIMVLLALESTGFQEHLFEASKNTSFYFLMIQFFHHPWNGLRFWDLIQPGFMFIAGTAMAFSLQKQKANGLSWNQSLHKILRRSFWLFFWGVLDYAVRPYGLSFELWDVLTQLAFTTLLAFLIFNWPARIQVIFCIGLLLITEVFYRFTNIPGFDQPFTNKHNFGNYVDLILMNKINYDGWVAINCIPTAVHTIAGAVAGKFLLTKPRRIVPIIIFGLITLIVGYGLDLAGITPIIKRISTSSFVLASLGWCLLALAFCYWWVDIKNHKKNLEFFTIVGMNSIFIYLFFEIVGARWFNDYVGRISNGIMEVISTPETLKLIITSLCIFTLEWLLCYFLYKNRIFFKL